MAQLLKGAPVAEAINKTMAGRVQALKDKKVQPTLAIVRVGERPDDLAYQRGATKRCEKVGVAVRSVELPADATQEYLIQTLQQLNDDVAVHGVLLLRPLPKGMDDTLVRNALIPEKDVDGITDCSLAGVFAGTNTGYAPCTAQACMEILQHYGVALKGRRAVVVGRSLVVGKPVAMMLLAENATVTMCHTRTVDLAQTCQNAEVLIVSAGRAGVVDAAHLAPGQVVIDVGINVDEEGNLHGDVDFAAAEPLVKAITPVPGGVGTVTTSVLVGNVVRSAEKAVPQPKKR